VREDEPEPELRIPETLLAVPNTSSIFCTQKKPACFNA